MKEVLQKLENAKNYIRELDVVKDGKNTFSKYSYFTPSLVSSLVLQASREYKLATTFSLSHDEHGMFGTMSVFDLDSGEQAVFETRTAIPQIKATNETQQIGGALTYTKRYLQMSVFEIVDNAMDFDTKDNTKKITVKLTKGTSAYKSAVKYLKEGGDLRAIRSKYEIGDEAQLIKDSKV